MEVPGIRDRQGGSRSSRQGAPGSTGAGETLSLGAATQDQCAGREWAGDPGRLVALTDSNRRKSGLDPHSDGVTGLSRMPPPVPVDKEDLRPAGARFPTLQLVEEGDVDVGFAEGEVRMNVGSLRKVDDAGDGREHLQVAGTVRVRSRELPLPRSEAWLTLSSGNDRTTRTATPSSPAEFLKEMSQPATVCKPSQSRVSIRS